MLDKLSIFGAKHPIDIIGSIGSIGMAMVVAALAYFLMPSRWLVTSVN